MTEKITYLTQEESSPRSGNSIDAVRFASARAVLKDLFGFTGFRPGQEEVVRAVLGGGDTLAVMPTGGGKSLCYQIPALVDGADSGRPTIVVSPLISLMADQVESLRRVFEGREEEAPVATLHSAMSATEQRRVERGLLDGSVKVLLAAPERFRSLEFTLLLKRARPARFVIDEAHCLSEWGHSFRPEYLYLRRAIEDLGGGGAEGRTQIVALTATADPRVRSDIVELLGMRDPRALIYGFDRPNLSYEVREVIDSSPKGPRERRYEVVLSALKSGRRPAVVYAHTRRQCETLARFLSERGVEASAYHAGMPVAERGRLQVLFMDGELAVVVATIAFGMGVDKPDIRQVIHAYIPSSIPAYVQESGRAGRDGERAECLVLYSKEEVERRKELARSSPLTASDFRAVFEALKSRGSSRLFLSPRELPALRGLDADVLGEVLRALEGVGAIERRYNLWSEARLEMSRRKKSAGSDAAASLSPAVRRVLEALARLFEGRGHAIRVSLLDLAHEARVSAPVAQGSLMSLTSLGLITATGRGTLSDIAIKVEALSEKDLIRLTSRFEEQARREALHIEHVDDYISSETCRRQRILDYFGDEEAPLVAPCYGCDVCKKRKGQSALAPGRRNTSRGERRKAESGGGGGLVERLRSWLSRFWNP